MSHPTPNVEIVQTPNSTHFSTDRIDFTTASNQKNAPSANLEKKKEIPKPSENLHPSKENILPTNPNSPSTQIRSEYSSNGKNELKEGKWLEGNGGKDRAKTFRDILIGKTTNQIENHQQEVGELHQTTSQSIILASSYLQSEQPPQIIFSEEYLQHLASRWERALIIRTG